MLQNDKDAHNAAPATEMNSLQQIEELQHDALNPLLIETSGGNMMDPSLAHQTQSISIEEAVNRVSTGKFQYRILFAAGFCFMADSIEIVLLSFLTLVLKREWGWDDGNESDAKMASITSSMFLGALLGASVLGPLGDKIGRRPTLFRAAFIISFFGLVTAFCDNYFALLLVRFCVGFG
jgi:AAHS family 4-hydroxybenzoate transporter-like MFS transporter